MRQFPLAVIALAPLVLVWFMLSVQQGPVFYAVAALGFGAASWAFYAEAVR